MEIDQVVVKLRDWRLMLQNDTQAKARIRATINDLFLYFHIMPVEDDELVVSLRELEQHGVIDGVCIVVKETPTLGHWLQEFATLYNAGGIYDIPAEVAQLHSKHIHDAAARLGLCVYDAGHGRLSVHQKT